MHSRAYVLKTLWHNRAAVTIATGFVQLAKLITEFQSFRLAGFSFLANRPHVTAKSGPKRFTCVDAPKHLVTEEETASLQIILLADQVGKSWKCPRQNNNNN